MVDSGMANSPAENPHEFILINLEGSIVIKK
jgi:hypothetical protein